LQKLGRRLLILVINRHAKIVRHGEDDDKRVTGQNADHISHDLIHLRRGRTGRLGPTHASRLAFPKGPTAKADYWPSGMFTSWADRQERDPHIGVGDRGPDWKRRLLAVRRFWRADRNPVPVAGLGLAIVAKIAEIHGGTATVATRAGGGAVFTRQFPRREP